MRKITDAIENIGEFLQMNGLSYDLRAELSDIKTKEKLLAFLPVGRQYDNFELNCLYQINVRRLK